MCGKRVGAAMPAMNKVDWGSVAAVTLGAAASNVVVNSIVNTVFSKKTKEEKQSYAGYAKLAVGLAGTLYAPNQYLQSASLGILVDGGVDLLRANVPQLSTLVPIKGVGRIGETIDLSREDWAMAGIESDYSVGYAQEHAVYGSGGVN